MRSSVCVALSVSLLAIATSAGSDRKAWSTLTESIPGPAEAIGHYSAGCLVGGAKMPASGIGYQMMRLSRQRNFAHPELVAAVTEIGKKADRLGVRLLIGDFSQSAGGPMPSGHISHQIGLDADIWFSMVHSDDLLSRETTERRKMASVVDRRTGTLRKNWAPEHAEILKSAAAIPTMARIFVNPVIKQTLCGSESGAAWLRKLRPWWGHDAHFHIRISCPADSPDCHGQPPPPSGTGCNADLNKWVADQQTPARKFTGKRKQAKPVPARCVNTLEKFLQH